MTFIEVYVVLDSSVVKDAPIKKKLFAIFNLNVHRCLRGAKTILSLLHLNCCIIFSNHQLLHCGFSLFVYDVFIGTPLYISILNQDRFSKVRIIVYKEMHNANMHQNLGFSVIVYCFLSYSLCGLFLTRKICHERFSYLLMLKLLPS